MSNLLLLVLLMPLFSFLTIASSGRFLGVYGSMLLSVLNICCALIVSLFLFFNVSFDTSLYIELWN
jgi:hypothetical protein